MVEAVENCLVVEGLEIGIARSTLPWIAGLFRMCIRARGVLA